MCFAMFSVKFTSSSSSSRVQASTSLHQVVNLLALVAERIPGRLDLGGFEPQLSSSVLCSIIRRDVPILCLTYRSFYSFSYVTHYLFYSPHLDQSEQSRSPLRCALQIDMMQVEVYRSTDSQLPALFGSCRSKRTRGTLQRRTTFYPCLGSDIDCGGVFHEDPAGSISVLQ